MNHPKLKIPIAMAQTAVLVGIAWLCTLALIDAVVRERPRSWVRPGWPYDYVTHAIHIAVALGMMSILNPDFRGSFGLSFPKEIRYLWPALWIGAASGVFMLVVDYYPALIRGQAPGGPYDPTVGNVVPWLLMQGILVGLAEETMFRSLFLGYFMERLPTQVRLGRWQVSLAGVMIAVVFSLAHASAFWHVPFPSALVSSCTLPD